jgi:hypothetical protein
VSAGAWGALGTVLAAIGVPLVGWWAARATKAAALATAEAQRAVAIVAAGPQAKQVDLSVLQATVKRVDEENVALRQRQSRFESLLRAFAVTCDRWAAQMRDAHIDPVPPHPLVEEYNRTGV